MVEEGDDDALPTEPFPTFPLPFRQCLYWTVSWCLVRVTVGKGGLPGMKTIIKVKYHIHQWACQA